MAFLGDEDTTHDEDTGADDTDTGADDESTADDEEDTSQNNDSEDGDDESSDDGDDDDGKGDSKESTDTSKDKDTEDDADDGEEPETRRPKTNAEWAAWRKSQKDKKSKDSQKKGDDADDAGDEESEDDDLSPEDAKAIDKRIAKAVAPFKQQALEAEVDAGISQFLNANPDFKPFEAKARRFALHPSRQNIPIKSIFYEVAGDKLLKIGADRVRKADKDAKKTKTGGSATNETGNKSYKDMSLDEFGKELETVKTKGR